MKTEGRAELLARIPLRTSMPDPSLEPSKLMLSQCGPRPVAWTRPSCALSYSRESVGGSFHFLATHLTCARDSALLQVGDTGTQLLGMTVMLSERLCYVPFVWTGLRHPP